MNEIISRVLNHLNGFEFWFAVVMISIGFAGWYYLSKKKEEQKLVKKQIVFIVGIIITVLVGITINNVIVKSTVKFSKQSRGILVLNIDGDDAENTAQHDLVNTLNEFIGQMIEIRACDKTVSEAYSSLKAAHRKARKIGEEYRASVVIWGKIINKSKFHPRITIIDTILQKITSKNYTLSSDNIDDFELSPESISRPLLLGNILLGLKYEKVKLYDSALIHFNAALSLSDSSKRTLSYLYHLLGVCHGNLAIINETNIGSNLNKAVYFYNLAIELDSNNANLYANRGNVFSFGRAFSFALNDFNRALKLYPNYARALSGRGLVYFHTQEYRKSIFDFTKSISINPDNIITYNNRGASFVELGYYESIIYYDSAILDLNIVIEKNPKDINALTNRANAYSGKEFYDFALKDYNKIIKLNPNDAITYFNRGQTFFDFKKFEEAAADYRKSIQIDSLLKEAYNGLGEISLNSDSIHKAINFFEFSLQIDSTFSFAYYNLAKAYALKENVDISCKNLKKALELNADLRNKATTDKEFDEVKSSECFKNIINLY